MAPNSGKERRAGGPAKTAPTAAQKKSPGLRNWVRIVGGEWRGRRIRFPTSATLRPTPDRVRETLFNWLQQSISGARCIDLFAGSAALGLEALSRGAREALFVENDARVAAGIRDSLVELKATRGRVLERDAFAMLAGAGEPFDIAFVDPPFARGGLSELCKLLEAQGWLAKDAFIYLEQSARAEAVRLPDGWVLWRETKAGEVLGMLARRRAPSTERDDERMGAT